MLGVGEELVHRVLLHDAPLLHHDDPAADLIDHIEVVADEEIAQVVLLFEVHQQPEDLGLDGHVQGAHRLVGQDEPGVGDDGAGDGDPLPLSAGDF